MALKTTSLIVLLTAVTTCLCHKYAGQKVGCITLTDDDFLISHPYLAFSIKLKTMKTYAYSILSSVLVGLSGVLPLLLIPIEAGDYLRSESGKKTLNRWLSFAVGSILGDVFMHLLPEAWAQNKKSGSGDQMAIGLWVILGILIFLIIEKVFIEEALAEDEQKQAIEKKQCTNGITDKKSSFKTKELKQSEESSQTLVQRNNSKSVKKSLKEKSLPLEPQHHSPQEIKHEAEIKIEGYLNLFANVIDNFTHGLAVGGSYMISTRLGVLTTFCILIHEIPHEVSDFVILLRAGFNRTRAAKAQLLTATGSVFGAIFALYADSATTGRSKAWILPFTSGGFLYIALVSLAPTLIKEGNPRESLIQLSLMLAGQATMVILSMSCD